MFSGSYENDRPRRIFSMFSPKCYTIGGNLKAAKDYVIRYGEPTVEISRSSVAFIRITRHVPPPGAYADVGVIITCAKQGALCTSYVCVCVCVRWRCPLYRPRPICVPRYVVHVRALRVDERNRVIDNILRLGRGNIKYGAARGLQLLGHRVLLLFWIRKTILNGRT